MTERHFKATGTGGEELTQDKQPMSETEMLELMAKTTPFGYPPHSLQDNASRYSKSIRDRTHER